MTNATQVTPLRDIPKPGTKLNYEDLTMTFIVDEDLANYQEIHGWLVGLGFPISQKPSDASPLASQPKSKVKSS